MWGLPRPWEPTSSERNTEEEEDAAARVEVAPR
eukprot:CAMPEP_0184970728 /NCGR_PEP_ID=MMETSP1098-20130426/3100_1 /TAXON_ID=89044 /ORGANISM="Spumella elongata, Strain CCAP 955/1" /LENGTH=32 /DNA_ID= /DNA_START= /DNA_END= /DNA_ORIENTATION=